MIVTKLLFVIQKLVKCIGYKIFTTLMYAHEIGRIADDPYGAALTTPNERDSTPISAIGFTTG